jgi:hypothetical protein
MMYRLENDCLLACFDGQGRLTWLENKQAGYGNVIDSPAVDSFKLVFQQGENWENVVFGGAQTYQVDQSDTQITWTLACAQTVDRTAAISVILQARLSGEDLVFAVTVDNRDDALVTDVVYPQIGVIKSLAGGKPALLWPRQSGEMVRNVGALLSDQTYAREEASALTLTYPGPASMQWMALVDGGQTLYLGGHDPLFHASELRVSGSQSDRGAITLTLDRFAFIKAGETWSGPETVLKLYTGSWHQGADAYIRWAATWRPYHQKPQWIQDMLGYFLVINKQQFGDNLWPYDTLPELYERAVACGCDTLGLFGWYESGHDNQYPDLTASETLGGAEALRANIKTVQAAGGHVTLYFQGHLIDILSDFYKNGGHRLEAKSRWLVPYYEQYNKFHNSAYLKHFTRKTFSIACPSCLEWQDLMREKAEFLASFGQDGVLFDQIGGVPPYPCFDERHPHVQGKPSLSMSLGRQQLLDAIQTKTKAINPEFGLIVEHITDLYSAYIDCLHGINARPDREGVRGVCLQNPARPEIINYPELFRYCFPDVIITVRNKHPYLTPQFANYAFTFGFRYEVELRYLADREEIRAGDWAEWNRYAAAVSALRKRYWPILTSGAFRDECPLQNANPALVTKAYVLDSQLAVAVWNDTAAAEPLDLQAPGYRLREWATIEGTSGQLPGQMGSQQIGLAIYERGE